MKVNTNPANTSTSTVRGTEASKTGKATAKSKLPTIDTTGAGKTATDLDSAKIEMSKDALAMQKAKSIASKDVNNDAKVAQLQKLIDAGEYKVDSEAVADRLVNEHLLMGD
jgi:flagellar biosynthesis anti-sigma factor FlgM